MSLKQKTGVVNGESGGQKEEWSPAWCMEFEGTVQIPFDGFLFNWNDFVWRYANEQEEGFWRTWGGHSMQMLQKKLNQQRKLQENAKQNTKSKIARYCCYYSVSILRFMIASFFITSFSCLSSCLAICHVPPLPCSHTPVKTKYQSEVKGRTWGFLLQPIMESLKLGFDSGIFFFLFFFYCRQLNCIVSYGMELKDLSQKDIPMITPFRNMTYCNMSFILQL